MKHANINGHDVTIHDMSRRKKPSEFKCSVTFFAPNSLAYRAKIFKTKREALSFLNAEPLPVFTGVFL